MASADRPDSSGERTIQTTLVCKPCRNEFDSTSLIGGTFEALVAWMEFQACPKCGTQYVVEHAKHRGPEEYLHPSALIPPPRAPRGA